MPRGFRRFKLLGDRWEHAPLSSWRITDELAKENVDLRALRADPERALSSIMRRLPTERLAEPRGQCPK
jgi:hypothetical protein